MPAIVIAGAGPAGLSVAARTAAAGLETLVLERNPAIGIPLRTSGGSWIDEMNALEVPERFYVPIRRIRVIAPHVEATFDYPEPRMCVLDVRRFYQWLAERALDTGASLRVDTRVHDVIRSADRISAVRVREPDGRAAEIEARLVVDATGYPSTLARRMQLHDGFPAFGVGFELDLYAPRFDPEEVLLIIGRDVAPNGYAWAFPYGNGRVRLGVGIGRPHCDAHPESYLETIRARVPALRGLEGASAIETHRGLIPLAPPAVPLVRDNVVVTGDAAGQASSLVGEGIRYAIRAGRAAGDAIVEAFARGDLSSEGLRRYGETWRRQERNLRLAFEIYRRIVCFDDADWDREVGQLKRLTADQFAEGLKGNFTLRWLLGVMPRYTGMLVPGRFRSGLARFARDTG